MPIYATKMQENAKFDIFWKSLFLLFFIISPVIFNQEPLNSYLDGAASQKIWKRRFLGNISNSCCWVTRMGLKPTQKKFFEKISKNKAPRGVQNFGLIEDPADLPLEQSQKFWPQVSPL